MTDQEAIASLILAWVNHCIEFIDFKDNGITIHPCLFCEYRNLKEEKTCYAYKVADYILGAIPQFDIYKNKDKKTNKGRKK